MSRKRFALFGMRAKKDGYNRERGIARLRKVYPLSAGKVLDAARTITTIRVKMSENGKFYTKTLFLADKHQAIQPLFELSEGEN